MSSTVKIGKNEAKQEAQYAKPKKEGDGSTTLRADVEVPFTEFRNENKMPYVAKYLGVENVWDADDMEGDLMKIENYMEDMVEKGEVKNDVKSVEKKLKALEKMANVDALEGQGLRINKLVAFINYMKDLDNRKRYVGNK